MERKNHEFGKFLNLLTQIECAKKGAKPIHQAIDGLESCQPVCTFAMAKSFLSAEIALELSTFYLEKGSSDRKRTW